MMPRPTFTNFHSRRDQVAQTLSGRRVLVVGLGRFGGGVGVTRWLAHEGAIVTVTDQADAAALAESIESLQDWPITFRLGGHNPDDLTGADLVVVNPAVDKRRSEFYRAIVASGIARTTEMNLFCERCQAPVIGVTGSFGKSTTSAMIAEGLSVAVSQGACSFRRVHLGGNIGRSLLGDLNNIDVSDVVVLEMSNAQLEDTPLIGWSPAVAAITNIHPHHLDRYELFAGYVEAKLNILAPSSRETGSTETDGDRQNVLIGALHVEANQAFCERVDERVHSVRHVSRDDGPALSLTVPGSHNHENARLALATLETLRIDSGVARNALESFHGLPHRLEFVTSSDGVDYFNDSKSTSPSATIVAIDALPDRPLVVIVGGKRKEGVAFDVCASVLSRRCRAVVCMGECGRDFVAALSRTSANESLCVVERADSLEQALVHARRLARSGDAILLSPGAASFDAYANYEKRGEHFIRLATTHRHSTIS